VTSRLLSVPVIAVVLSLTLYLTAGAQEPQAGLGLDVDPSGNTPTSIQTIDPCGYVAEGDSIKIDLFVQDITDLLAWEILITYDSDVLEIRDRDVQQFQAANEGSQIIDASQNTPDTDGSYTVAAVDTADPPAPDSGSGVLARLTLKGKAPGISQIAISKIDLDNDGTPDQGPFLRNVTGQIIGDEDGDTFFDGPIQNAEVRVGQTCTGQPIPARDSDGGINWGVVIGVVIGSLAALAVVGILIRRLARRSTPGLP
jgi:hypothetical protein